MARKKLKYLSGALHHRERRFKMERTTIKKGHWIRDTQALKRLRIIESMISMVELLSISNKHVRENTERLLIWWVSIMNTWEIIHERLSQFLKPLPAEASPFLGTSVRRFSWASAWPVSECWTFPLQWYVQRVLPSLVQLCLSPYPLTGQRHAMWADLARIGNVTIDSSGHTMVWSQNDGLKNLHVFPSEYYDYRIHSEPSPTAEDLLPIIL